MSLKPTWAVYHRLGKQIASELDPNCTFQEIGDLLGISKQRAYHEAMVALGKIVYQLKKHYCDDRGLMMQPKRGQ